MRDADELADIFEEGYEAGQREAAHDYDEMRRLAKELAEAASVMLLGGGSGAMRRALAKARAEGLL